MWWGDWCCCCVGQLLVWLICICWLIVWLGFDCWVFFFVVWWLGVVLQWFDVVCSVVWLGFSCLYCYGIGLWLWCVGYFGVMVVVLVFVKLGIIWQCEFVLVDVMDRVWVIIVWDDLVNLMSYVIYVFQKLFGYSELYVIKLMLQVYNEGKVVVFVGS